MKYQLVMLSIFITAICSNAQAAIVMRVGLKAPQFTLNGILVPKGVKYSSIDELVAAKHEKKKEKVIEPEKHLVVSDQVSTKLAANEEFKNDEEVIDIAKIKERVEKQNNSDDLVFYDYTAKKPGKTKVVDSIQTVANAPIPDPIKAVIEREKQKTKLAMEKAKKKSIKKPVKNKRKKREVVANNTVSIQATEVDINTSEVNPLNRFQFKSLFHEESTYSSDADGAVDIEAKGGTVRGYILYQNSVATKIEVPLKKSEDVFEVPMITYDSLREYLGKNKIEVIGGMYLAKMGESIADIDLDTDYDRRVLLDQNFREVKQGEEYKYVFFIGVTQGNIEVKALTNNNEIIEKIVTVTPDEILYNVINVEYKRSKKFSLEIENTLSRIPSRLNLQLDDIKQIIGHGKLSKIKAGSYELSGRARESGSQSYLEANFLDDKIYFSLPLKKRVTLPSNEFIAEVLNQLDISDLEDRCLVQVNLSGEKETVLTAMDSDRGDEPIDILYLDKDGVFTDEISTVTKKMFVLGTRQGTINLKFKMSNEKVEYRKSICSAGTYLVEHF